MEEPISSTPDYTMGFSDEMLESLRRFTAENSAAHLLPHLRPGLRVLDFGCGPGTISLGLAKAAAPGELHGVDMEESQIELARQVAAANGLDNAIFHVGDVADLPFEDGFFDVAHGHNVLMHIPDTAAALAEVKRVLKPGGILSCREMICASSFTQPDFGVIRKSWDMFEDLLAADDGHPQMGKELKGPPAGGRVHQHPGDRVVHDVQHARGTLRSSSGSPTSGSCRRRSRTRRSSTGHQRRNWWPPRQKPTTRGRSIRAPCAAWPSGKRWQASPNPRRSPAAHDDGDPPQRR